MMNKHPGVCQRVVVFLILLTYVRGILTRVCVCVCVCAYWEYYNATYRWINRDDIDFSTAADIKPLQVWWPHIGR